MRVAKHKVVSIDYTLTNDQGSVLDSSKGQDPLTYIHGTGGLLPGLESALEGKEQGEGVNVSLAPDQAYGQKDPALVQPVPRTAFQGIADIRPGMQFRAQSPSGQRIVTVVDVQDQMVTIDANHPLAGQTLKFDVTVVGVRDATDEELAHGHTHGPGGHQH